MREGVKKNVKIFRDMRARVHTRELQTRIPFFFPVSCRFLLRRVSTQAADQVSEISWVGERLRNMLV